jgi:hypothetical protein
MLNLNLDLTTIVAIIGAITGVAALLAYIFRLGGIVTRINTLWEAKMPERLSAMETKLNALWQANIPEKLNAIDVKLSAMDVKLNILWQTYMEDQLGEIASNSFADRSSGYHITKKGEAILPAELKKRLEEMAKSEKFKDVEKVEDAMILILQQEMESLREVSISANIKVGAAVAVASLYALKVKNEK